MPKPRSWPRLKPKNLTRVWLLLMLSTTSCASPSHNQYFCPVETAYDLSGQIDSSSYRVKVDCFKSQTKKMKACYSEAQ